MTKKVMTKEEEEKEWEEVFREWAECPEHIKSDFENRRKEKGDMIE